MKASEKPPTKKTAEREKLRGSSPAGERRDAERGTGPKPAAEDTEPDRTSKPSEEEVISNLRDPVTNQDAQDKITNAGQGDIPIANK